MSRRSVIVTGGASGIGLGITKHLLRSDTITVLDINPETGANAIDKLRAEVPLADISFEQCDVSSWESQETAFARVYAKQGRIDVVFANAGITEKGSLLPQAGGDGPRKPNLATLNVNLVGVVYSVQLAIHYMSKNTSTTSNGLIVCTASNAGLYPFPMAPMYAASKHGVVGLVRSLARPLLESKIRINALAPAVVETNIASDLDLFKTMVITPMSTVTAAVSQLLEDDGLTGKIAEIHGERVTFAEPQAYVDEDTEKNIENFWTFGSA